MYDTYRCSYDMIYSFICKLFFKVIAVDSQHFQAHTALGVVLLQVLDQSPDRVDLVESAIRAFSAAHQLQPTNEDVLYNYAISLIKVVCVY